MKRSIFHSYLLVFVLGMTTASQGQEMRGRMGFGFAAGAQKLFGDVKTSSFGYGGEGLFSYRFTERVSINLVAGYNTFSLQNPPLVKDFTSNLIFGNLVVDVELLKMHKFRPFLMWGIGGFNFQVQNNPRFNDGEILAGSGVRFFLNNNTAFSLSGSWKYTTGDDLDAFRKNGTDTYLTLRAGLIFYKNSKKRSLFQEENLTEARPIEQSQLLDTSTENAAAENTSAPVADVAPSSAEVLALQAKIADLEQTLIEKEQEIAQLKQTLEAKNTQVRDFENTTPKAPAPTWAASSGDTEDFSTGYKQGLSSFEDHQYQQAINIFQALLRQFPSHSLASNCEYWIGESYFGMRDYTSAVEAFTRVDDYPRSNKKDAALLMLGRSYQRLGEKQKAHEAYGRLLREHAESEFATKARRFLDQT